MLHFLDCSDSSELRRYEEVVDSLEENIANHFQRKALLLLKRI